MPFQQLMRLWLVVLITFCAAFFIASTSRAQKVKLHLQGGVHASAVNSQEDSLVTNQNGMQGGYNLGLDLRLGGYDSWIYLQPGAHFYQARMNIYSLQELAEVENYKKSELQVSQIKLPLNLGFYVTGTDGLLKIRASAGLTPSMIVDQTETELSSADTDFQTFGVGVNAGIGLDFTVLTVDLKYEHGSTKIYKSADANMNFITLTAGLIIPPSL